MTWSGLEKCLGFWEGFSGLRKPLKLEIRIILLFQLQSIVLFSIFIGFQIDSISKLGIQMSFQVGHL